MTLLQQLSDDVTLLVAQSAPAVVGVRHKQGQGSGFLISPDGFILTNNHVIKNVKHAEVRFKTGEKLGAEVVGTDAATDLAVLRVGAADLPYLRLDHDTPLAVGVPVVAIGNPYRFEGSVSFGVVSAVGRTLPGAEATLENLVQTDAAVNPGNSGGPLINAWGKVVGITTAVVPFAQGIGFAVPATTAHWVTAHLIQRGTIFRPYLGIAGLAEDLSRPLIAQLEQTRALRIVRVEPGTPADHAGLQAGDLILQVDDVKLGSIDDLQRELVYADDRVIVLELFRNGRWLRCELAASTPKSPPVTQTSPHPRVLN